jgi:hypothetical protein
MTTSSPFSIAVQMEDLLRHLPSAVVAFDAS